MIRCISRTELENRLNSSRFSKYTGGIRLDRWLRTWSLLSRRKRNSNPDSTIVKTLHSKLAFAWIHELERRAKSRVRLRRTRSKSLTIYERKCDPEPEFSLHIQLKAGVDVQLRTR